MPKSYSEQRQAIYFKAARDLRAVAAQTLDDCVGDVECGSPRTVEWVKLYARKSAEQANAMETLGHEQSVTTNLQETLLHKSRVAYSDAIDRFRDRCKRQGVDADAL